MNRDTERDLDLASSEIEKMADSTLLEGLQSAWESFVFRLERAWVRTERVVQAQRGDMAQSWFSANTKLRRTDPLLVYLRQARNAETHAISTSIGADRIFSIADRYGRPFRAEDLTIELKDGVLSVNINSLDIGIEWTGKQEPADPYLQPIINRGKIYEPPARHLGNRLTNQHPVAVATLGLQFYRGAYAALP
jgi:hypothetical protein